MLTSPENSIGNTDERKTGTRVKQCEVEQLSGPQPAGCVESRVHDSEVERVTRRSAASRLVVCRC